MNFTIIQHGSFVDIRPLSVELVAKLVGTCQKEPRPIKDEISNEQYITHWNLKSKLNLLAHDDSNQVTMKKGSGYTLLPTLIGSGASGRAATKATGV